MEKKTNTEKVLDRLPLHKLPFCVKLFWAKCFIRMFKGFGDTFPNDLILFNELKLWIETEGRPTTSNVNYYINSK